MVEHGTENAGVVSSILTLGTRISSPGRLGLDLLRFGLDRLKHHLNFCRAARLGTSLTTSEWAEYIRHNLSDAEERVELGRRITLHVG